MPGENWLAMKDGFSFRADNPIELLGVVGIYEEIKPATDSEYWWRLDQPDLLTELSPS